MKTVGDHRQTPRHPTSDKKIILIVDDNVDNLELNKLVLEMEGFQVVTALGGSQALASLANSVQPDLILLDMCMDEMTGTQFLMELERRQPHLLEEVPIVLFTANQTVESCRVSGIIHRPIDVGDFVQAVRQFMSLE